MRSASYYLNLASLPGTAVESDATLTHPRSSSFAWSGSSWRTTLPGSDGHDGGPEGSQTGNSNFLYLGPTLRSGLLDRFGYFFFSGR